MVLNPIKFIITKTLAPPSPEIGAEVKKKREWSGKNPVELIITKVRAASSLKNGAETHVFEIEAENEYTHVLFTTHEYSTYFNFHRLLGDKIEKLDISPNIEPHNCSLGGQIFTSNQRYDITLSTKIALIPVSRIAAMPLPLLKRGGSN